MKYSIIIAVYNRLDEVKELLKAAELFDFDRNQFEIIFSDDGSSDGFDEFIKNYNSQSGLNIRYIYQQNKGPGAARNHAMSKADGDYFIYVDSDCIIPSDWLSKIDSHLKIHNLDAFGGPDTWHPSFSPLLKAIDYAMTSFIGTGGTRGSKKSVAKFYPRSFNMGIHRKIYEKIGGMGKLRHGQDMEFSSRIYRNGYKVGLIADAFVYHKRRTNLKRFFKQIFNWAVARINLGRIDKNMLKTIHFAPSFIVLYLLCLLTLSFFNLDITNILWKITGLGALSIALLAFSQSLFKYKNIKVAFLSIFTLYIQVFAYGIGLLYGISKIRKGKTITGFSKNYYK